MKGIRCEREPRPRDRVIVAFRRWFIPNGTFLANDKLITFAILVSVRQYGTADKQPTLRTKNIMSSDVP